MYQLRYVPIGECIYQGMYQLRNIPIEKGPNWELLIEGSTDWRLNQFGDVPIEESILKGIQEIGSLVFILNQKIILNFDSIFTEV